jgi:hypothetical protein
MRVMRLNSFMFIRACLRSVIAVAAAVSVAHAQAETYTAIAKVQGKVGAGIADLTVTANRFATDAERDALLAAVKKGGTAAARTLLKSKADAGTLRLGSRPAGKIKYVYARNTGAGRLLTIITADPIVLLGSGLPEAKPAAGFDLGLVLIEVAGSAPGKGEMVPAAKVKVDAQGAIVTEDYSGETVQLTQVVKN